MSEHEALRERAWNPRVNWDIRGGNERLSSKWRNRALRPRQIIVWCTESCERYGLRLRINLNHTPLLKKTQSKALNAVNMRVIIPDDLCIGRSWTSSCNSTITTWVWTYTGMVLNINSAFFPSAWCLGLKVNGSKGRHSFDVSASSGATRLQLHSSHTERDHSFRSLDASQM